MMKSICDKSLLTATDEQAAFRVLYDRYWKVLYEKALHRLGNIPDSQDVVQEVFISLWRNRMNIQIEESLSPYLFAAIRYAVIKKIYRNSKLGIVSPLSPDELVTNGGDSTNEQLDFKDLENIIERNVSTLPRRMQEIYRMSRIEQLPTAEIADRLNVSEQTVKNTLTTALKKLRIKLSHLSSLLFIFF